MSFILIQQQKISFADIPRIYDRSHFSKYSNAVIDFCNAWMEPQPSFEIYTSGSTGKPQKIVWSRSLMLWSIANTAAALQLKPGMHSLLSMDINKAGGKMLLARALEIGMSIEIVEPSSHPFEKIISSHYDFAAMVPFQIHQFFSENKISELNKIDKLIIGGAPLNTTLTNALQILNTKVYATYGMTETASHIALQQINGEGRQDYFTPLKDVVINYDTEGCAIISTPFHDQLFTNDIIEINEDKSFKVLGRRDNIINSGGFKISLEKVEEALDKTFTALKINFFNYFAYKQPDEKLGEALIVVCETKPMNMEALEQIMSELKLHLHKHELPKRFYFSDQLEYFSSGKIDRKKSALRIKR